MSSLPWDIYAEQLLPLGNGHPLWIPEPNHREIEIGDVGILKYGEFIPLFNATVPADDPKNWRGVPEPFEIFSLDSAIISSANRIMQPRLYSRSVKAIEAAGDVAVNPCVPRYSLLPFHFVNISPQYFAERLGRWRILFSVDG